MLYANRISACNDILDAKYTKLVSKGHETFIKIRAKNGLESFTYRGDFMVLKATLATA